MRLLLAALLFLAPAISLAAQEAMVTVEQAAIRERPTLDAKIIESKATGTKIRVSSYNKDGWYKTKTGTGQYGWIWQADISVLTYAGDMTAANLDMKEQEHERRNRRPQRFFFRLGGNLFGIISADVSDRLGLGKGHWYFAPGGFGEVAVRLDDRMRLALRLGTYSTSSAVTRFTVEYDITMSGTPLLLGLDADITQGETFDITAGFYAGLSLSNRLSIVAPGLSAPNGFTLQGTNFAMLINFAAKYRITSWLSAVGELGLYYSQIPKTPIPAPFNGDGPFRDSSGGLATLHVNQVGPILGLGLQFAI